MQPRAQMCSEPLQGGPYTTVQEVPAKGEAFQQRGSFLYIYLVSSHYLSLSPSSKSSQFLPPGVSLPTGVVCASPHADSSLDFYPPLKNI